MIKYQSIKTGDIFKFTNPIIKKVGVHHFSNSATGQHFKTTGFSIQGLLGTYPYANGLVKQRFIAFVNGEKRSWGDTNSGDTSVNLYLLDNYKPDLMGPGYAINLSAYREIKILKKVGRELNLNLVPIKVKTAVYNSQVTTGSSISKLNKLNKTVVDKIKYLRKNFLMFTGMPTHIQMAFSMVYSNFCTVCGVGFTEHGVRLIDLENTKEKDNVAKKISAHMIENVGVRRGEVPYVLPVAFKCCSCKHINFVFKNISRKTRSFTSSSYIDRVFTLNLDSKETDALEDAIINWEGK